MAGVNKVIIVGHLGNDLDMCYGQSGNVVCNISVATTEKWKDKNGERKEETEWHRVVSFNKLAEIMGEYLQKGSLVYIEGKIKIEKYTDKDGVEKYSTKIYAKEMQMLGGRGDSGSRESRPREEAPRQTSGRSGGGGATTRRAPPPK